MNVRGVIAIVGRRRSFRDNSWVTSSCAEFSNLKVFIEMIITVVLRKSGEKINEICASVLTAQKRGSG